MHHDSIRGWVFRECGRLSRQVLINATYDDEVLMELFSKLLNKASSRRWIA
jgi:hypothetical protein